METGEKEEKSIRRNLYRVLRKTGVTRDNICLTASFIEDLRFDKVDWTIFTYYLERMFNISVIDDELQKLGNVNDTLRYLRSEMLYVRT
ncbi:MAG: acyl carrier protein [Draconibacterium sp.]